MRLHCPPRLSVVRGRRPRRALVSALKLIGYVSLTNTETGAALLCSADGSQPTD